MLPRLFMSNMSPLGQEYVCIRRRESAPQTADEIQLLRDRFIAAEFNVRKSMTGPTIALVVAAACVTAFFYHGSLRAYPQTYSNTATQSGPTYQGSNVESNPYIYAGNASPGGYPQASSAPQSLPAGSFPIGSQLPASPPVYGPPQNYSTSPYQTSNVVANPYIYAGNATTTGQTTTLRNPLIPGVVNTAPNLAAPQGQPPAIGSGPTPAPVTPGMGDGPLTPNSNAFPQVSNVDATTQTTTPPSKANNTALYQTNVSGQLGAPLVIPATSALDTTTVTGAVSPYLQAPPSTQGTAPGLIYAKQYTNGTYNPALYYPPASVGTVGVNGGITGIAPVQKWSGAQAQTSHDYGLTGGATRITTINGKQPSEYYNTDFGQRLPVTLQTTGSPASGVLTMTQDGSRLTQYLNWQAADSTTEQTAATTPSDYTSGVVPRNPNLYTPSTTDDTWNLFGHRQVFMYNQNGYNVPHSPTATGTPVYAQQTTAYY